MATFIFRLLGPLPGNSYFWRTAPGGSVEMRPDGEEQGQFPVGGNFLAAALPDLYG